MSSALPTTAHSDLAPYQTRNEIGRFENRPISFNYCNQAKAQTQTTEIAS